MITKRPDLEGRISEVTGSKRGCCGRGFMQLIGEELMAKEMTTKSHKGESRGSERDHRRKKEKYVKANGIRQQLTQEEYEKEKAEIAVHLELLMELLQKNMKDQRHGLLLRKRVKWQRLQQKRDLQISMQLTEEQRKLEQRIDVQLRQEELRAAELEEEISIGGTEEKIIDDFLSYWVNPDQLDNVKPCIFVADNCDVITGSTEEDVPSCETVTAQEVVLMDVEEVNQSEAQIREVTVDTVEHFVQTESLCMNAGDEMVTIGSLACESIEDCT